MYNKIILGEDKELIVNMSKNKIPQIGLGTWLLTDFATLENVIETALNSGYRHLDTAQVYNNEYDIGEILTKQSVPRDEIFLTTKVAPQNYLNFTRQSVEESLTRLQTDYLDLVLLHAELTAALNLTAYKELIALQKEGKIKHVGVSNFSIEGIEQLIKETGVKPYCNQIVCSPTTRPVELEEYCIRQNIDLVGYSIIKPYFSPNPFYPDSALSTEEKEVLDEMCLKYQISIGQLLNHWAISHGYHIIPKSSNPSRVKENFHLNFSIDHEDLQTIDQMNRFTAKEYQEHVTEWETRITPEMLETGLLYTKHFN